MVLASHRSGAGEGQRSGWLVLVALSVATAMWLWIAPAAEAEGEVLELSALSGSPGETVTVSGSGWFPGNGPVTVFADALESNDLTQALVVVDPDDSAAFVTSLTVPDRPAGTYQFFACQICVANPDGFPSASAPFTITPVTVEKPQLALTPGAGKPGETVTASGSAWFPREGPVSVFADESESNDPAKALVHPTPDANGAFTTLLTVPDRPAGPYQFFACQRCSDVDGFPSASALFTITSIPVENPQLTLTPVAGKSGETVTASGSGWFPTSGPVVLFAAASESNDPARSLVLATPDDDGAFTTLLTVPDRSSGSYTFFACQSCGDPDGFPSASAPFTITSIPVESPQLTLTPGTAMPGETVTVSGSGWAPKRGPIVLFVDASESNDPTKALVRTAPDDSGAFTTSLTVPDRAAGIHQFFACQACGDPDGFPSASAPFTIKRAPKFPLLLVGGISAALVLVAGVMARNRYRRSAALPRPRFQARPDLSFDVQPTTKENVPLPSVRLVPHDDESDLVDRVEVRP